MKRIFLTLCLTAALAVHADALEYTIDAPEDYDFGKATSIEVIHTANGGAWENKDISKNTALIPPAFGSESMNALNTGTYLTPNLAADAQPTAGAVVNGSGTVIVEPGSAITSNSGVTSSGYTELTSDLYYSAGHIGTLNIPTLDLSVKIYQGTDSATLAKGVGHFEETSIWDGTVALAAHNRGTNSYFGDIHTLEIGAKISLTTKLGTRTYKVVSVEKIKETDTSGLAVSGENTLALYTCVRNQSDSRWCVKAVET